MSLNAFCHKTITINIDKKTAFFWLHKNICGICSEYNAVHSETEPFNQIYRLLKKNVSTTITCSTMFHDSWPHFYPDKSSPTNR